MKETENMNCVNIFEHKNLCGSQDEKCRSCELNFTHEKFNRKFNFTCLKKKHNFNVKVFLDVICEFFMLDNYLVIKCFMSEKRQFMKS